MKKLSNLVINNLGSKELSALTYIVEETLAVLPVETKKFTTTDLWRIQSSYRTGFSRRYK